MRKDLEVNFGIGTKLQPTRDEVEALRQAYTDMVEGRDKGAESLYASECGLAATAKRILAKHAHVAWTTGGHTDGYVPSSPSARAQSASTVALTTPKSPKIVARLAGYKLPAGL